MSVWAAECQSWVRWSEPEPAESGDTWGPEPGPETEDRASQCQSVPVSSLESRSYRQTDKATLNTTHVNTRTKFQKFGLIWTKLNRGR